MAAALATYRTRVSGLWNTRHVIENDQGVSLGVLTIERNGKGLIARGTYKPEKGEVLVFRREPGILRSQFSVWTEGREWLGSSLRDSFVRREIGLSTSSKELRLLPVPGFGRGWRLYAPKTGEMARIEPKPLRRDSVVHVFRRIDFELVVFAYFLSSQVYIESFLPGRDVRDDLESIPNATKV